MREEKAVSEKFPHGFCRGEGNAWRKKLPRQTTGYVRDLGDLSSTDEIYHTLTREKARRGNWFLGDPSRC